MTWIDAVCPITEEAAAKRSESSGDYEEFKCPFCHKFRISRTALGQIGKYPLDRRIELLALAREVAGDDKVPFVTNVP